MERLLQDLRYGVRVLAKRPGFTAIAVLALALGIGANTAIFSMVNRALVRTSPVTTNDEILKRSGEEKNRCADCSEPNEAFADLACYRLLPFSLSDGAHTERGSEKVVSCYYFSLPGIDAAIGRAYTGEDN